MFSTIFNGWKISCWVQVKMLTAILTIIASILSLLVAWMMGVKVRDILQYFQNQKNKTIVDVGNLNAEELARRLKEMNDKQKEIEGRGNL